MSNTLTFHERYLPFLIVGDLGFEEPYRFLFLSTTSCQIIII